MVCGNRALGGRITAYAVTEPVRHLCLAFEGWQARARQTMWKFKNADSERDPRPKIELVVEKRVRSHEEYDASAGSTIGLLPFVFVGPLSYTLEMKSCGTLTALCNQPYTLRLTI